MVFGALFVQEKTAQNPNVIGRDFPGGPVVKLLCFH